MSGDSANISTLRTLRMLKRLLGAGERVSLGKLSFASALVAFSLFLALWCVHRAGGVLFGGKLLNALNRLGMVRQERSYIAELRPSSVFALNDANAVIWLTCLTFILAGLGLVLALCSEYKRESTLYASTGFIVATLGIGLLYPLVMVTTQTAGAIALVGIRKHRTRNDRTALPDKNSGFRASEC